MSFLELAAGRRSIRGFEEKEVSDEMIGTLLEAARWAPSAGNLQPWRFIVVRNKSRLEEMIGALVPSMKWIRTAKALIVVIALPEKSAARYRERGAELYCIQDTAAAIQNILLCAKDLGLGACWVGAFPENECARLLSLAPSERPVAIIPIGHAAVSPKPTPRAATGEITTFID